MGVGAGVRAPAGRPLTRPSADLSHEGRGGRQRGRAWGGRAKAGHPSANGTGETGMRLDHRSRAEPCVLGPFVAIAIIAKIGGIRNRNGIHPVGRVRRCAKIGVHYLWFAALRLGGRQRVVNSARNRECFGDPSGAR